MIGLLLPCTCTLHCAADVDDIGISSLHGIHVDLIPVSLSASSVLRIYCSALEKSQAKCGIQDTASRVLKKLYNKYEQMYHLYHKDYPMHLKSAHSMVSWYSPYWSFIGSDESCGNVRTTTGERLCTSLSHTE